jgi:GDP-L-fucose synthase
MIKNEVLKSFSGKNVLVTGGTGLIGIPLVHKLHKAGARVRVVSLDSSSAFGKEIEFIRGDLCEKKICEESVRDMEFVFHLAGVKGGIGVAKNKAATFLVKNILLNTQIMEAARRARVERFLYASSICIYPPAEIFKEENAQTGLPHPSDKFGGMAKLIGEMQIEAYKMQYSLGNFFIARPSNTYGPFDNFNPESALIIPSLIYRIFNGENPLTVWGDGTAVRDFIFSEDVADFLMLMVERNAAGPMNVGSGAPVTIGDVADIIVRHAQKFIERKIEIRWDPQKPAGEKSRVTSIEKARDQLGWSPQTEIAVGISTTIDWFSRNRSNLMERYSILSRENDV